MKKNLVLFVHGMLGSGNATWGKFPNLIREDAELKVVYDVKLVDYETAVIGSAPPLQTLAEVLRTEIDYRYADYSRVILICHSMGGLVARRYLVNCHVGDFPTPVNDLLFFATPHNGTQIAEVAGLLAWNNQQLEQMGRNSEFLETLNNQWFNARIENKLKFLYVCATGDKVVPKASVQGQAGTRYLATVQNKDHKSLVKPSDTNDMAFIIVKKFLIEAMEREKSAQNPRMA